MRTIEYNGVMDKFATELKRIEDARKNLEKVGLKIPGHLEDKLSLAESQHAEAENKFE